MLGNYVTVRRYEGVPNPGEAARRVQEGFVPLISKIRGFVAYYWVDAGRRGYDLHEHFSGPGRRGRVQ